MNSDITGYRFAKGPIDLRNTWFGGFNSTSERTATAIGNDVCMNHCHPRNSLFDIMFDFDDVSFYSTGNIMHKCLRTGPPLSIPQPQVSTPPGFFSIRLYIYYTFLIQFCAMTE